MVKVAWKTVNGYGPYAYLQKSVKVQGHVHSKHIAYLGKAGKGGLIPGKHFNVPSSGGFAGGRVRVPFVGEETEETLKPGPLAAVASMKAQVAAGLPAKQIVPDKPVKTEKAGPALDQPKVVPNKPAAVAAAPEVAPNTPKAKAGPAPAHPKVAPNKPATAAAAKTKAKAKAGPALPQPEAEPKAHSKVAPNTEKAALVATLAAVTAKKAAASPKTAPKISLAPQDNKGKALISAANVKKLEAAAAEGDLAGLDDLAAALSGKMLHKPKQAAILNAAAELKGQMQGTPVLEGDGGSGLGQAMSEVDTGKVKLPDQAVPDQKAVEKQRKAIKAGQKNYDADLEQISGKKGSNEGGLFKDKHLETFHYVKWPNSEARAKMEALTALLYAHAGVPVPSVRHVNFKGKDAVISDWIDEAAPMTLAEHPARSGELQVPVPMVERLGAVADRDRRP